MLDLFAMAESNADAARARLTSAIVDLSPEQQAKVNQFLEWLEQVSSVSVNVRLLVVIEILNGRSLQNIYEWAEERSQLSSRPSEEFLREKLGAYYGRRLAFDESFIDGRKFRYGALYAGGPGTVAYNPYCLVLRREFCEGNTRLAYLPGDSLAICFPKGVELETGVVKSAVAPHGCRQFMVANERLDELLRLKSDEWVDLVISRDMYFEAVFVRDVNLEAIDLVRISKAEHERIWDMAFSSFGRKLSDAELANVQDFIQLRRSSRNGLIRLEVIE